MIAALRQALASSPEPKRVSVKTWREDARDKRVSLAAYQRITVTRPKARFAALEPHKAYTAWANPGRSSAGLMWVATVVGFALLGRKTGRGPLKDLYNWVPFSVTDEER